MRPARVVVLDRDGLPISSATIRHRQGLKRLTLDSPSDPAALVNAYFLKATPTASLEFGRRRVAGRLFTAWENERRVWYFTREAAGRLAS